MKHKLLCHVIQMIESTGLQYGMLFMLECVPRVLGDFMMMKKGMSMESFNKPGRINDLKPQVARSNGENVKNRLIVLIEPF